jgi:hypothetical protein
MICWPLPCAVLKVTRMGECAKKRQRYSLCPIEVVGFLRIAAICDAQKVCSFPSGQRMLLSQSVAQPHAWYGAVNRAGLALILLEIASSVGKACRVGKLTHHPRPTPELRLSPSVGRINAARKGWVAGATKKCQTDLARGYRRDVQC